MSVMLRLNYYVKLKKEICSDITFAIEPEDDFSGIRSAIFKQEEPSFAYDNIAEAQLELYAPMMKVPLDPKEKLPARIKTASLTRIRLGDKVRGLFKSDKLDEGFVHLVIVPRSTEESVADFLRSTTCPVRSVDPIETTSTQPYDAAVLVVDGEQIPFYLASCFNMAQLMTADLFDRVLPDYPVIDPRSLNFAKAYADGYNCQLATQPLFYKPSVHQSTDVVLSVCTFCTNAVGWRFHVEWQHANKAANVEMDLRVLLRTADLEAVGGIAVKDESPTVFEHHCTDSDINSLVGTRLELGRTEHGFRAILFKLALYMIKENLQWGAIHSGVNMRIVRIEHQEGRLYLIISEEIPVNSDAPGSMYALICYLLLTSSEDEIPIFDGIKANVPGPTLVKGIDPIRQSTREPTPSCPEGTDLGNPSSIVLHLPVASVYGLADVSMQRLDSSASPRNARNIDVYRTDFLGAGRFGRVFRGDAFAGERYCGPVVIKISESTLSEELYIEDAAYRLLVSMYDTGVPRYFGLYNGEDGGFQYTCILLSYSGEALKNFDELSLPQRIEVFRILCKIHQAGIVHNDIRPSNVLQSQSGMRLMDFSVATFDHRCEGTDDCKELVDTANELKLTRDHIESALRGLT